MPFIKYIVDFLLTKIWYIYFLIFFTFRISNCYLNFLSWVNPECFFKGCFICSLVCCLNYNFYISLWYVWFILAFFLFNYIASTYWCNDSVFCKLVTLFKVKDSIFFGLFILFFLICCPVCKVRVAFSINLRNVYPSLWIYIVNFVVLVIKVFVWFYCNFYIVASYIF